VRFKSLQQQTHNPQFRQQNEQPWKANDFIAKFAQHQYFLFFSVQNMTYTDICHCNSVKIDTIYDKI
jgi:hypothetical protein